ncbi:MAG: hypothetical protein KDH94_04335 [Coxiellaceae bacterium]|nr:hypothetical protein [Coxiellaceae bacterium]
MRDNVNFSARDKILLLLLVDYVLNKKPIPAYADLTQAVGLKEGKALQRNSSLASAHMARLEDQGFLHRDEMRRKILLLPVPAPLEAHFTNDELQLITQAFLSQSTFQQAPIAKPLSKRVSFFSPMVEEPQVSPVERVPTPPFVVKQFDQDAYGRYIDELLFEVKRVPGKDLDAMFQLALNHFQDWHFLSAIEEGLVFPDDNNPTWEEIFQGLQWLNDAYQRGHDEIQGYMFRLLDVVIKPNLDETMGLERYVTFLEKCGFKDLAELVSNPSMDEMKLPVAYPEGVTETVIPSRQFIPRI